ncbi:MAG: DNA/RNA non-specific endonuclease [Flavobacteriaceae bacterium]|nr:DNA/RNA non-specific endonuclease [Flavobacteriaceae bacterium]
MKSIILLLLILLSVNVSSQEHRPEIHNKHFLYGYPYGTPKTNDLIIRDIYALSNNDDTKFADWLAYKLTTKEVVGGTSISRRWKKDPWLDKNETLEPRPDDYKDANKVLKTDRGHQAPLASFKNSADAFETNYLSNITPQKADLNQGAWVRLETSVRNLVKKGNEVYVMTGPLYEREMPPLPKANKAHKVPSGYWKIVCTESDGVINVSAFIFEQETPRRDKVLDHLVTIDEVEKRSKLDFFWLLEDEKENDLEKNKNVEFATKHF